MVSGRVSFSRSIILLSEPEPGLVTLSSLLPAPGAGGSITVITSWRIIIKYKTDSQVMRDRPGWCPALFALHFQCFFMTIFMKTKLIWRWERRDFSYIPHSCFSRSWICGQDEYYLKRILHLLQKNICRTTDCWRKSLYKT